MSEQLGVAETADLIIQTIDNVDYIGATPQFISGLVRLFEDPHTDINNLARFISREPAVCVQILRLANCAYFSRGAEIRTVHQAIVHLGLSVIKKFVIAFEMIAIFRDANSFSPFSERNFLKSCMGGALVAEEFGRRLGLKETEELFICGLLRDFGVLVLKQYFPYLLREINECIVERQCGFREASRNVCGFDHRYISYLLFTKWNLPSYITAVFQEPPGLEAFRNLFAEIVNQADWILKDLNYGQWDHFAEPQESISDLFAFYDDDFKSAVLQQILNEADDSILSLGF
jgi:HD-like signal output (HDOD) protein